MQTETGAGNKWIAPEVGNSTCLRQCFKQANIMKKIRPALKFPAVVPEGVFKGL